MEQLQFDDNFAGEGFAPVRQIDYTKTLDRRNQRLARAEQEALAQIDRNNTVRIQNAQDSGNDLIALSKFSNKLTDFVGDIVKEKQEEEKAEKSAQAMEQFLMGKLDTSDHDKNMETAKDQAHTAANVEAGILGENGENYEASSAVGKSTAFSNVQQAKVFVGAAVAGYPAEMTAALSRNKYPDRASYISALRQETKEWAKRNNVLDLPPQFLANTIYPKMIEAQARAVTAWSKQNNIDDSAMRQDDAAKNLELDLDISAFLDATRNTLDRNGNPLGYAGAWDLWNVRVTELRQAGMLSATDVENMKKQLIPGDPKGRTYGEHHAPKFKLIERQVAAEARQIFNESEAQREVEAKQFEQQFVDAFRDGDPDGHTDKQIDEAYNLILDRFGYESRELLVFKKNSVDAKTREKQKDQIEDLIKMNLLTPERLKNFDPQLQRTYLSTAQGIAKLRKDTNNFKTYDAAIEDMVKKPAKVVSAIGNFPAIGFMVAKQKARFHELLNQYSLTGQENPAALAYAQLDKEFKAAELTPSGTLINPSNPYSTAVPKYDAANERDMLVKTFQLDETLSRHGKDALDLDPKEEVTLFTKTELDTFSKGYGKQGWRPSPQLEYVAEQQGVDPLTVLNRTREAQGMDALPASPAMEIIQNELSPTQQRLLNQFKTPARSSRGLIGQTKYYAETVPGGYGQTIQNAASKYNIDPAIIAGLIETESGWNPNAVSSSGARGLTQFMPGTASDFDVDVTDPVSAIDGAAKYLRYIMDTKGVDINTALYMYNAGPNHNRPYPIPSAGDENKNYLPKVLKAAGKYGYGKKALNDPGTMRSSIAQQL
ncbi:MAG: hypothetical protein CMQ57_03440 [Gammaproteobacteria bacterium]|nr:hypothetical protein [Gammaproteobacteria bacterium]